MVTGWVDCTNKPSAPNGSAYKGSLIPNKNCANARTPLVKVKSLPAQPYATRYLRYCTAPVPELKRKPSPPLYEVCTYCILPALIARPICNAAPGILD